MRNGILNESGLSGRQEQEGTEVMGGEGDGEYSF